MSVRDGSSSGGETRKTDKGNVITLPTPAYMAPAGASLGQSTTSGGSLVSDGGGRAVDTTTGEVRGTATGARVMPDGGQSLIEPNRGGGGPVDTTVSQKPPEGSDTVSGGGPRPDFSQVLAGQIKNRPNRTPARSTNFVSLIGQAGGLGRKSAGRTLIGGA